MIVNKLIDIVIVSYSKDDYCKGLTEECLKSLLLSEDNSEDIFNIIVIESQDGVTWEYMSKAITTYKAPLPYGYHKFLNFGRKKGNAKWVALCNNDLEFMYNWFSEILEASEKFPNVISFSPICPVTQPMYGINPNTGYYKGYEIRKHISGWCMVHKREIYDIIGDLDERFHHWFSDNDFSMTLIDNDIEHILVSDSVVMHHNKNIGKTTEHIVDSDEEMHRLTIGSQSIFYDKWNKIIKNTK